MYSGAFLRIIGVKDIYKMQASKGKECAMNQNIYLKLERNSEVRNRSVTIGDVGKIYCGDSSVVNKLKTVKILTIPDTKKGGKKRYSASAMKVIELIQEEYPSAQIENIGECDFIVDYIDESKKKLIPANIMDAVKIVIVCIIVFFGSAYAIMAYNNDVGTVEIFDKMYELILDESSGRGKWMEIMYSIGLTGGIVIFYNHFGGKSFSNDPTPIEVEMNTYEQDIDYALIERGSRSGKEEDVQ